MLGGGSGTARLLAGFKARLGGGVTGPTDGDADADSVTAIISTGGDIRLHNLHISTDLDTCLYATAGALTDDTGTGTAHDDPAARAGETFAVATELECYGAEAPWFRLGDKEIATHLMRTRMLDAGYRLSQVTAALCAHWRTGVRLLPMTDDRVETHVIVATPADGAPGRAHEAAIAGDSTSEADAAGSIVAVHLREWERRFGAGLPPLAITPIGAEQAAPAPGVLEAIAAADLIVIGPDNPVTALGSVLAVPGIREALAAAAAPVIGVSPVVGGQPVAPGATDGLGAEGVAATARGIAGHYGARAAGGLLDGWVCGPDDAVPAMNTDPADDDVPAEGETGLAGLRIGRAAIDLNSAESAAAVAAAVLDLARD